MNNIKSSLQIHSKIINGNLVYGIDKVRKEAIVIGYHVDKQEIVIPDCIKNESQEYLVTSIRSSAFSNSKIERIIIPPSVNKIEKECFRYMDYLQAIKVMPNNQNYSSCNDKCIIGKSSPDKQLFDVLIFAIRSVSEAKIPDFIEIIGDSAFEKCSQLQTVEFSADSQLRIIGQNSFSDSSIEFINIPPHVTKIDKQAFSCCKNLTHIEIPTNSELRIIEEKAFCYTRIESITIPSYVDNLKNGWCDSLLNLTKIKVLPNNQHYSSFDDKFILGKSSPDKQMFDVLVFAIRNIRIAKIPDFIEIIGYSAFEKCSQLQKVEFSSESTLRIIGTKSFASTSIEFIDIPQHVTKICEFAFSQCSQLRSVYIPENSELKLIENFAFSSSAIRSINIPTRIKIENSAFYECYDIKLVEVNKSINLKRMDKRIFNQFCMIPVEICNFTDLKNFYDQFA